ncbi:restriction endonuclease subunit S [Aquipseudomonas alcaligenes]|uniref:restriction endonuclease subunit S n=1 Tax=Aquipseudomonas alcaligenes TaxID=43263 RepID=UPI00242DEB95|nr:restriction endonuclease subunit S [Pseudomonas alcaligenes]
MSELPNGWVSTTIGEINDYSSGNIDPLKSPEQVFELYSVPIYPTGRPEHLPGQDIGSTKQCVEPGDVLLCKINPRINRVWMVGPKSELPQIGSSEWVVIRQPLIHSSFLRYQLSESSFRDKLCSEVSGVGGSLTRAQPKKVATYPLVLPPFAEQTRIAAKLDELLAQVDTLKARIDCIPALLKRFRQSVLAAAVSGRLTEEWRRTHDIDEPEVSWKAIELVEISALVTSGSRGWADYYASNGAIFIRSQDINTDELDTSETAFVRLPESSEGKRTRVQVQDILITITGANVGKVARVKQALPEAYVSQHVALVRLQRPELAPFVELYLKDVGSGRKKLTELAYGGGKPGLNLSNIRDLAFALPSLEEQTEIVLRVEQLFAFAEQLEAKVATAQARIDRLTQSILAKAFRGELAPQDPNDEPASLLLERIQAQRAAAPKAKRGRKASA